MDFGFLCLFSCIDNMDLDILIIWIWIFTEGV